MGYEKWDEAQTLLSHAVKNMQQVLGYQHPRTLLFKEVLDRLSEAGDKMNSQQMVPLVCCSLHTSTCTSLTSHAIA